jgi:ferredoxin
MKITIDKEKCRGHSNCAFCAEDDKTVARLFPGRDDKPRDQLDLSS